MKKRVTLLLLGAMLLGVFGAKVGFAQNRFAEDSVVAALADELGLPLVPASDWPKAGTYWRVHGGQLIAPTPCPPFDASMPVYALGPRQFLVDDPAWTETLYGGKHTTLLVEKQVTGLLNLLDRVEKAGMTGELNLMSELEGEGLSYFLMNYGSNDLYLSLNQLTNTPASGTTAYLTIHPPWDVTNGVYDLFSSTNLAPLGTWALVWRCAPGQTNLTITNLAAPQRFFILGLTNDTDEDSMTDAFEQLCAHTDFLNGDQNTNGIEDGWEWNYFGSLNEPANGDYDGDGFSNYEEYACYGTDPNSITFDVSLTNQYVRSDPAFVQANVSGGIPFGVAVLVDSTNFSAATWNSYNSSNIPVGLGSEGWHEIWIGLRGRLNTSEQTWRYSSLKLDCTPPAISITSPASSTVTWRTIQIQGSSSEQLAAISYDLTNSVGLITNRPVVPLGGVFDAASYDFTTNYFQAFDVEITNGPNGLTFYATDRAGNMSTTHLTFTVDYSAKTNPPSIQLYWPQDGTIISGSNFTCRGHLDDPTAKVIASVTDANSITTEVLGQVGRDGDFWIEYLPLADGTNALALSVADDNGNNGSTNLTVLKSSVVLTITSPVMGQPVTGTISDPSYTVWVNGIQATNDGNGTWYVTSPQLTLDNPTVRASAIPTNIGPQVDVEKDVPRPDGVIYTSSIQRIFEETYYRVRIYDPTFWLDNISWNPGGGSGRKLSLYTVPTPPQAFRDYHYQWTGGRYPVFGDGVVTDMGSNQSPIGPPSEAYGATAWSDDSLTLPIPDIFGNYDGIKSKRKTALTMITGGGSADGMELYMIWGSSQPHGTITVGGLGQLDNNGILYAALPTGSEVDVTPRVNARTYTASVGALAYKPHIYMDGQDVTETNTTVCVGQKINLTCSFPGWKRADFPEVTGYTWTVPGYAISNYVATASSGVVYSNFPTVNSNVVFFWADGGNQEVVCKVKVMGKDVTAKATFQVYQPSVAFTDLPPSFATNAVDPTDGTEYLQLGFEAGAGSMAFRVDVNSAFEGRADYRQLVNRTAANGNTSSTTSGQYWLDNYLFHIMRDNNPDGAPPVQANHLKPLYYGDAPGFELAHSIFNNVTTVFDQFKTYVMFRPNIGISSQNIYVPIARITWSWSAATTYSGGSWSVPTYSVTRPAFSGTSSEFPVWPNVYSNQ